MRNSTAKASRGDSGTTTTTMNSASRVPKNHELVEFVGCLDEAQVVLGFAAVEAHTQKLDEVYQCLIWMQRSLFNAGILTMETANEQLQNEWSWNEQLTEVEKFCSTFALQEPLRSFILPGGSELAARIELARVAIRRLERSYCACNNQGMDALPFLNRLSTLAFVLARHSNEVLEVPETLL